MIRNLRGLCAFGLAAFALLGADGATANAKPTKKPQQVPETGVEELRPVTLADQQGAARLEEMTSRSDEGLVEVLHDDGSASMWLQGRFMSVMLASPLTDGTTIASCHTGEDALKRAKAKPAKAKKSSVRPAPIMPSVAPAREWK